METNKNIEPRIDIDDYLEKPYWVVDILPRQVPPNANGQFFRIEDYLLKHPQIDAIYKKFLHILNVELLYLFLDRFVCIEHTVYVKGINLINAAFKQPLYRPIYTSVFFVVKMIWFQMLTLQNKIWVMHQSGNHAAFCGAIVYLCVQP